MVNIVSLSDCFGVINYTVSLCVVRMMKNIAKIGVIALLLWNCERVSSFPPEPHIELKSFEQVRGGENSNFPDFLIDHVELDIYFTDGDGDIGLDTEEPPHCLTCDHYFNLYINVYSKVDGEFELTYDNNARIENITPDQQNTTLEGHIVIPVDIFNRFSDTVIFDFYLEYRSLNKSNVDQTPEIFINL